LARDRIGGDGKCQHAGKLGVVETKSAIAFYQRAAFGAAQRGTPDSHTGAGLEIHR
jgi:hypothetical protein